jgi:hypothetical protein
MRAGAVLWIIVVTAMPAFDTAQAELAVVESASGIRGTNSDGQKSIASAESSVPLLPGPQGEVTQRTVTPFGSPLPPNQLTPAPVLPFHPNRPLVPSPSPASPNPGSGRIGR